MEPDVIRMYSSSPPPLEDGAGEEEDDFGEFDGFSSVPNSVSFTEFDTPTTFNQVQALTATSPPELLNDGRMACLPSFSTTTSNSQEGDLSKANDELSNQHQGSCSDIDSKQLDCVHKHSDTVCTTTETLALNGFCDDGSEEKAGSGEDGPTGGRTSMEENTAPSEEEKVSGNQTETQTLSDQPLTTTMEQCGDTAGRVPSPLPQEDTATTPCDHSQPPQDDEEDDDKDFGDFDSGGCFSVQGFADFDQLDVQPEHDTASAESTADAQQVDDNAEDDFGEFNTPRFQPAGTEEEVELPPHDDYNSNNAEDKGQAADFPGSDSFGNFNSVAVDAGPRADGGWSAFSEEAGQEDDDSWAAFDEDQVSAPPAVQEEWSKPTPEAPQTTSSDQPSRTDNHSGV
ncbi:hypothetical protein CRUP_026485 [Coryphaenoides rupestris]|nr:hypothetical protein CRUP_026485 [Coryphaenoides rupestris]